MADPIIIVKDSSLEVEIRVPGGGGCNQPQVLQNGDKVVIRWPRNSFKVDDGTPRKFNEKQRGNGSAQIERH